MTDARYPERWLNDRRFLRLSADAHRLYVTGLVWSVGNRTDGVLYDDDLDLLVAVDRARADELDKAGLWQRDADRWLIVDFDDTQTTREQLEATAEARAVQRQKERDKKARQRAHAKGDHSLCTPVTCDFVPVPPNVPRDVPWDDRGGNTRTGQDRPGQDRKDSSYEEGYQGVGTASGMFGGDSGEHRIGRVVDPWRCACSCGCSETLTKEHRQVGQIVCSKCWRAGLRHDVATGLPEDPDAAPSSGLEDDLGRRGQVGVLG